MHRVKARLLLEESLFGRNIAKRHAFNFKLLQGGEDYCRESMQQFLDARFPGADVIQLDTMGLCTVRVANTENKKVYYVKQLDTRQYNYYVEHERVIRSIHAPYVLHAQGRHYFQIMPNFGERSRYVGREEAERMTQWALKQLEYLHGNGLYHGDILTGVSPSLKVNEGNILRDESGTIRLIDFGPLMGESRTDGELLAKEEQMLQDYHRYKKTRPPPTPARPKRRRRKNISVRSMESRYNETFGSEGDLW